MKNTGHRLEELYKEAQTHLALTDEERRTVEGVVKLLNAGNQNEGLRYFSEHTRYLPELSFAHEGVDIIVKAATKAVSLTTTTGGRGRVGFTVGKPRPK